MHFGGVCEGCSHIAPGSSTLRVLRFIALLLFGATFALLQVVLGQSLSAFFAVYALIGVAAIFFSIAPQSGSKADGFCLAAAAIFCGYIIFRAIASPFAHLARIDLYSCLAAFLVYGITAVMFTSSNQRMGLIVFLLSLNLVHIWLGLIQFGIGENFAITPWLETLGIDHRASGFYLNPDHLAGLLESTAILGLSVTCWSRWPKWARVITGYLTAACYLGLILTGSRGGYASVAASLLVFTFLSVVVSRAGGTALFRKLGLGSIIAFVTVTVAVAWMISQNHFLGERLRAMHAVDAGRLDLWRAAVEQWKLQPIVGTGSGTYLYYGRLFRVESMQGDPVVVHNDYLQLLCEYGVLGFLAFVFFLGTHLRKGWKAFLRLGPQRVSTDGSIRANRLALTIGALGAITTYLVHSMVDFNMHIPPNAMVVAFALGLLANPGAKTGIDPAPAKVEAVPRICMAALGIILLIQCLRWIPGEYYAGLARSALRDEQPAVAISHAQTSLKYEKQNPNIFFYLGRAFIAIAHQENDHPNASGGTARYLAALDAFEHGHRVAPLEESFPLDMAFVYDELGRFQEAEWMFSIARSLDPRSTNIEQLYQTHLQSWTRGSSRVSSEKP